MKTQEFRIGNWINSDEDGQYQIEEICRLSADSKNQNLGAKYRNGSFWTDLEHLEPIPLTDEWFIKWGFFKDGEYWSRSIVDYNYCFRWRDWAKNWAFYQEYTDSSDTKDDGVKYVISFDIEFVHQLQNLWFALLHKEITDNKD
jgi:hypothetical protein